MGGTSSILLTMSESSKNVHSGKGLIGHGVLLSFMLTGVNGKEMVLVDQLELVPIIPLHSSGK